MHKETAVAILIAVVAVLIYTEEPGDPIIAHQNVSFVGDVQSIFRDVTSLDRLPIVFPWYTDVVPVDNHPWKAGKLFQGIITVPIIGDLTTGIKLSVYQRNSFLEFECDWLMKSTYRLQFEPQLLANQRETTRLQVVVRSKRHSYFFHFLVKPVVRFFLYHQLRQRLFIIQFSMQKESIEVDYTTAANVKAA